MKNNSLKYCKECDKSLYRSEASATRAMNRYKDIKRVYYCKSSDGWHLTSSEFHFINIKKKKKVPSMKRIKNRLKFLKDRLKK